MKKKAISSIYGFVMIFLLTMASLQSWSSALGSLAAEESASNQGHQLQQMQAIEHLSLTENDGNLTILNNGELPSTVEYLRITGHNSSTVVELGDHLAIGGSLNEQVPSGDDVEVVTSLGNVFQLWPSSGVSDPLWLGTGIEGGSDNAQLYQSSYDSSFFLASGSSVLAFMPNGTQIWSFDAGSGLVTGVMPVSGGIVFVSVGDYSQSDTATLFELGPGGSVVNTFAVRLYQTPEGGDVPSTLSVSGGVDSSYAYYDGWFYSSSGQGGGLQSDLFPLLGTDSTDFYFYRVGADPYTDGTCTPGGNALVVTSYTPGASYAGGFTKNWSQGLFFGTCNRLPEQLVSSSTSGGFIAALFSSPSYAVSPGELYTEEGPYLDVLSQSGAVIYAGQAPSQGYSSIANDGTEVFLSLPALSQIQVLDSLTGVYTTYQVGVQASELLFAYGHLFAVSDGQVDVFDSSMTLQKTIDFSPLLIASPSLSLPLLDVEPAFLPVSPTAYAALVTNSTGSVGLVTDDYA